MAEGGRHPVAVAGGTGCRPGDAAGCEDHGRGEKQAFLRPDPFDAAVAEGDPGCTDAGPEIDSVIRQVTPEGIHDIRRIVGDGEDPPAAFDLRLHTVTPEEGEEVIPEVPAEGAVEESAVRTVHADE